MSYIIFEGVDFTGKTTISNMLYNTVKKYREVLFTKEPGSPHSPTCVAIREILMNTKDIGDITYALLFAADANEHLKRVVKPALEKGITVISDRCMISDFAYRPKIHLDTQKKNLELLENLCPKIIFLTCSNEELTKRIETRSKETPLLEYEKQKVMNRIVKIEENYLEFLYSSGLDFTIFNTTGQTIHQTFGLINSFIGI